MPKGWDMMLGFMPNPQLPPYSISQLVDPAQLTGLYCFAVASPACASLDRQHTSIVVVHGWKVATSLEGIGDLEAQALLGKAQARCSRNAAKPCAAYRNNRCKIVGGRQPRRKSRSVSALVLMTRSALPVTLSSKLRKLWYLERSCTEKREGCDVDVTCLSTPTESSSITEMVLFCFSLLDIN